MIEVTGAVLGDIAAVMGLPTGAVSGLLQNFLKRKIDEARDILLDELRRGEIGELRIANEDEAIAVIYRYCLAVRDGAARHNLRILAKVMIGLARRDRLFADEFNRYAESLSRLSRDEILVIGRLHHHRKQAERSKGRDVATNQYWPKVIEELVPHQFPTEEHVVAVCCSGMRSGLLLTPRDFDSSGQFATSPIMDEIEKLADFEEALNAEAKEGT